MANSVDQDQTAPIGAVCSGSTLFASIFNLSVMFGNYLQQRTSADDIFKCVFFLSLQGLKLNVCYQDWNSKNAYQISKLLQKQSDLGLHCFSRPFGRQLVFKILEHLPYKMIVAYSKDWTGLLWYSQWEYFCSIYGPHCEKTCLPGSW